MVDIPYPFAATIIRESVHYANGLGFTPAIHELRALRALGSLDAADECPEEIPVGGPDGKPYYVAGPDDDIDDIIGTQTRKCGVGNFDFIAPAGPFPPGSVD